MFKAVAGQFDIKVETLDIDPDLNPDHVASVFDMPFSNNEYDVVCAFQMLEHLPFEKSLIAFHEMARVARRAILISLTDAATRWPVSIHVPKFGAINFSIPKPRFRAAKHVFDGEHYWEVGKAGYPLAEVKSELLRVGGMRLTATYRVAEFPYHRFFVFETS
ncbi:class I SAM-dependent methyltransferase [Pseudomonadales bacterium]|nr:class I SAM-dependent methyltransferase [Pseudomonadales bacterium]